VKEEKQQQDQQGDSKQKRRIEVRVLEEMSITSPSLCSTEEEGGAIVSPPFDASPLVPPTLVDVDVSETDGADANV
jgi:hypothetical protein